MKVNRYICLSLALLMMIAAVSCSADFGQNVYYGGISGIVKDKDSSNGVSGVKVYLYTSETERDKAFSSWESKGGVFSDENCLYKAATDNNGKWSISKVVWMASDGAWGSDYDHIPVYIIYFSEDYGCWKEEKIELVSGTSNTNAIESKKDNIKDSSKLTINFREDNKLITDEINFTYTYNNGYRDITENVSTSTGQFTFDNLSYVKNENGTEVVIKDIQTPNGCWNNTSFTVGGENVEGNVSIVVDKASVTSDINLTRTKYDLGASGISGRITAPRSVVMDSSGKSVEYTLDSLVVAAEVNGKIYSIFAGNGDYNSENAGSFSVDFSGLAVNEIVDKTESTVITIKVFKQSKEFENGVSDFKVDEVDDEINPADEQLKKYTLNLDSNYSSKISVNIFIDSWT